MGWPTWEQVTGMLVALSAGLGWVWKRRDRVTQLEADKATLTAAKAQLETDLATAIAEADKTSRSHQDALAAKDAEIVEWRRQVERRDDRITVLEDRLYAGEGRP